MNSIPFPSDLIGEAGLLRLPAHSSTTDAEDLRVRLVLAADYGAGTEIDASDVESVGQAILQLLVAARSEAEQEGRSFVIRNPSRAFAERVTSCRLASLIGLEVEEEKQ